MESAFQNGEQKSASPSFQRLLSRIGRNDGQAVADMVVERFAGRLAGLAARKMSQRLQQRVGPEDIVQSVFATFFRQHNGGHLEVRDWESLWGLLARIAVWRICRHAEHNTAARRSQDREVPAELAFEELQREPSPADVLVAEEMHRQLMSRLAEKYRPIAQQIFDGVTHEEIARAQSTSLSTVERVHRRARECLAEMLTKEEAE